MFQRPVIDSNERRDEYGRWGGYGGHGEGKRIFNRTCHKDEISMLFHHQGTKEYLLTAFRRMSPPPPPVPGPCPPIPFPTTRLLITRKRIKVSMRCVYLHYTSSHIQSQREALKSNITGITCVNFST